MTLSLSSQRRSYPSRPSRVYLMGTCLVDSFFPQAGMDAIAVLQIQGVEVVFPQAQTCCGQPAWNSGYENEARAVARRQLLAFAEDIPVVVMMGSCAGMVHLEYPALFRGQPEAPQAVALAARTYEFSEFLINVLDIQFESRDITNLTEQRVALHTSCSSRRGMGVAAEHRELVGRLPGVQVVEPKRVAECCGFGGTFAVKQAEISAAMAHDKAMAMSATAADVITSADCGCLMNIGGTLDVLAAEGKARAMPTRHLATLVRASLDQTGGEA
jgi:L-lactate dehydrogenase complex protein LldE